MIMDDYGNKAQELQSNPLAKQLMAEVANGDLSAFQWMWDFWCFTHVIDDLVDKDKPVTGEEAARALAKFVTALSVNPFYVRNVHSLYPLIISACNRWVDGDLLDAADNLRSKTHSEVVRCGDVDVFLHVAYLTGGWDHMRKLSMRVRMYDQNMEV